MFRLFVLREIIEIKQSKTYVEHDSDQLRIENPKLIVSDGVKFMDEPCEPFPILLLSERVSLVVECVGLEAAVVEHALDAHHSFAIDRTKNLVALMRAGLSDHHHPKDRHREE